ELDGIVMLGVFGALSLLNVFTRSVAWRAWIATVAVAVGASVTGGLVGGVWLGRVAPAPDQGPMWEKRAETAVMSVAPPAWWYIPSIVPGFDTGFGNEPVPTALLSPTGPVDPKSLTLAARTRSVNGTLIDRFRLDTRDPGMRYINLMYLVEMRGIQLV